MAKTATSPAADTSPGMMEIDPDTGEILKGGSSIFDTITGVDSVDTHSFLIDMGFALQSAQYEDTTKITFKTMGGGGNVSVENPRRLHGYILGRATGVAQRENPETGEIFYGPAGTFECVGSKGDIIYKSSVLFLPAAFNEPILDALRPLLSSEKMVRGETRMVERRSGEAGVQIFVAVYCCFATNKAGYEWRLQPVGNMRVEKDPLAEMKLRLAKMIKPIQRQIEGKAA